MRTKIYGIMKLGAWYTPWSIGEGVMEACTKKTVGMAETGDKSAAPAVISVEGATGGRAIPS